VFTLHSTGYQLTYMQCFAKRCRKLGWHAFEPQVPEVIREDVKKKAVELLDQEAVRQAVIKARAGSGRRGAKRLRRASVDVVAPSSPAPSSPTPVNNVITAAPSPPASVPDTLLATALFASSPLASATLSVGAPLASVPDVSLGPGTQPVSTDIPSTCPGSRPLVRSNAFLIESPVTDAKSNEKLKRKLDDVDGWDTESTDYFSEAEVAFIAEHAHLAELAVGDTNLKASDEKTTPDLEEVASTDYFSEKDLTFIAEHYKGD
jgi:hypothetical protein